MRNREAILALAKKRRDLAAIAILEGGRRGSSPNASVRRPQTAVLPTWTEAELRAAWGDR